MWKVLDRPGNVQRKSWNQFKAWVGQLGLKTVLDAHFIQGNPLFILSVLGVRDLQVEDMLAKHEKFNLEGRRLWEAMRDNAFF